MTKATVKDFPGLSRDRARSAAKAANTIMASLRGLTCCQLRRVLNWTRDWVADPCNR